MTISNNNPMCGADVAIVIVNWNSGEYLHRCISCLQEQTVQPGKILIVDNASTDGSLRGIDISNGRICILPQKYNTGFAIGNNIGVAHCEGFQWVALLNPDAFPEPDWLEKSLRSINQYPQTKVFGCQLISANDPDRLDGVGDMYHVSGLAWRRLHNAIRNRQSNISDGVQNIFAACAAALFIEREVFLDVGGFDESYFCYFEDVDLGFRLQTQGYDCLYIPASKVLHIGSGTTKKYSDFSVYHGHRNLVWTYFKNMPASLFWLYLPQHVLLNIVELVYFTFAGKGRVIAKAKWDALKNIPSMLKKRKYNQKRRTVGARHLRKLMRKGWLTPYIARYQ